MLISSTGTLHLAANGGPFFVDTDKYTLGILQLNYKLVYKLCICNKTLTETQMTFSLQSFPLVKQKLTLSQHNQGLYEGVINITYG